MCRQKNNQNNTDSSVDIPDLLSPGSLKGEKNSFFQQNQNSEEFHKNKYGAFIEQNSSSGGKTRVAMKSDGLMTVQKVEDIDDGKFIQFQDKTENFNYPEISSNADGYVKKTAII